MLENHKLQSRAPGSSPCLNLDELLAFSSGKISATRKNEIENHLVHCMLCSDAAERIADLPDKDQLRLIIHSLSDSVHQRIKKLPDKNRNWRIYYRIAAVLLIGVSLLVYVFSQKPQHEILFEKYFKPYPNTIPITRDESAEIKLKRGLAEYEFENYEQAIMILEDVVTSEPGNAVAHFYIGVSFLCLNLPDQAIHNFQDVIQIGNNEFSEHAKWYLGLAFLKKGEFDLAKIIFKNLLSENQRYEQQAKDVLNSLEKMSE